jgi:hypothetical protein
VADEADEADKADAKAGLANEANHATEANGANEADVVDKTADVTEANEVDEADAVNIPDEADKAEANESDQAEANETNKAIVGDEIVMANYAAADKLPINNEHVIDSVIVYFLFGWQPFSLTKYCAIFSKEKGHFCPTANNNQFGIGSGILCFHVASEFESQYKNLLEADDAEANESNDAKVLVYT